MVLIAQQEFGNDVCSKMVMMIGYKEELVYNTWDFLNKYGT